MPTITRRHRIGQQLHNDVYSPGCGQGGLHLNQFQGKVQLGTQQMQMVCQSLREVPGLVGPYFEGSAKLRWQEEGQARLTCPLCLDSPALVTQQVTCPKSR